MPRNLFERCEVMFPVKEPGLRARLRNEILAAYLADMVKTRLLRPDGVYTKLRDTAEGKQLPPFCAQDFFMAVAEGRAAAEEIPLRSIEAIAPPLTPKKARRKRIKTVPPAA